MAGSLGGRRMRKNVVHRCLQMKKGPFTDELRCQELEVYSQCNGKKNLSNILKRKVTGSVSVTIGRNINR